MPLSACTFFLIYFQIEPQHPLADRVPHGLVRFQSPERVQQNIKCIEKLYFQTDAVSDCLRQHALNDIFYQYCSENLPQQPGTQLSQEVSAVIALFTERLSQRITLEEAAGLVNLSPNGLIGKFKAETGFTPIDYLIRLRMRAAKQLLSNTSLPISVIAVKVGYEDIYYFSNAFHKVCGCAPSVYRAESPVV